MKLNILKVSIFSLMLEHADAERLKEVLAKDATPYTNIYLQDKAYVISNCVYYLDGSNTLHVATRYNKYSSIKAMQKKDYLVATIEPQNFNLKSVKVVNVLWPQWQKVPALVLAKHLRRKYRA